MNLKSPKLRLPGLPLRRSGVLVVAIVASLVVAAGCGEHGHSPAHEAADVEARMKEDPESAARLAGGLAADNQWADQTAADRAETCASYRTLGRDETRKLFVSWDWLQDVARRWSNDLGVTVPVESVRWAYAQAFIDILDENCGSTS
jgi:hypothetical protein